LCGTSFSLQLIPDMGAGASTGVKAALETASEDDIKRVVQALSRDSKDRLAEALSAESKLDSPILEPAASAAPVEVEEDPSIALYNATIDVLASGALRLVSAKWLVEQPSSYIIQRCQDLPSDAKVQPELAAELFDELGGIVVVSYGWLTRGSPDPLGFHMKSIKKYLEVHLGFKHFRKHADVGVFWDYASLPQRDATGVISEEDAAAFRRGLKVINLLYGAEYTLVVQLTKMPLESDFSGKEEVEINLKPYYERGWCFFEVTVSSIFKAGNYLIDLGEIDDLEEFWDWEEVCQFGASSRQPPLTPEEMRAALEKKTFTNGADREMVAEKYEKFFLSATASASQLNFCNYGERTWNDEQGLQLAKALPYFKEASMLSINNHVGLSDISLRAIFEALIHMPRLWNFQCNCPKLHVETLQTLNKQLPSMKLKMLFLPRRLGKTEAARELQKTCGAEGISVSFA